MGGWQSWFNATVLKTVVRDERTVGSNPTPPAITLWSSTQVAIRGFPAKKVDE